MMIVHNSLREALVSACCASYHLSGQALARCLNARTLDEAIGRAEALANAIVAASAADDIRVTSWSRVTREGLPAWEAGAGRSRVYIYERPASRTLRQVVWIVDAEGPDGSGERRLAHARGEARNYADDPAPLTRDEWLALALVATAR